MCLTDKNCANLWKNIPILQKGHVSYCGQSKEIIGTESFSGQLKNKFNLKKRISGESTKIG